ncbi:MAG: prenyltransferase [Candidatus Anammoxibacter sp.]
MSEKIVNVQSGFKKPENLLRNNEKDSISLEGLNIPAIFSLARIHAYMPMCFFSTAVGLDVAGGTNRLMLLFTIGLANTFALVATFVFNNVEDVDDDLLALSPKNAIALGNVSKQTGYFLAALACVISISLSIIAGITVCLIILAVVVISFLYSWQSVRLKTKPFWDVFSNAVVGGLMFLSAAWSSGLLFKNHVLPICMIFFLGTGASLIVHQLSDYENDRAANIKTTVVALGKRRSYWVLGTVFSLMGCLLAIECWSGFFSLTLVLSFCIVAISLILARIILFPKQTVGYVVPWAINVGAGVAILVWYVKG